MTQALAILALYAASAATQRAYETLRAIGATDAAEHVKQAGALITNAVGLVVVDRARRNREQQEKTS